MEWVVTNAKTVEEAKEAALDELGVDEADAEFEVLEEPRQGLFGRQRGEARVRARVRPTSPRPKVERRGRGKKKVEEESNTRSDTGASAELVTAGAASPPPTAAGRARGPAKSARRSPASGSAGTSGRRGRAAPVEPDASSAAPGADDGTPVDEAGGGSSRRRPKALAPDVADAVAAAAAETIAEASGGGRRRPGTPRTRSGPSRNGNGEAAMPEEELSMEEQGQIAERFVVGLLERFKAPAQTSVRTVDDDTVEIEVSGTELGLLIGPKGQTLQAVQELTRTVVQRKSVARTGRIHVDMAGYRAKRREALGRFTTQVANDVIGSGVQRVLEPMSAADRKVVHDTANEIAGVRTVSEGEEPRRRVVIIPDQNAAGGASAAASADD